MVYGLKVEKENAEKIRKKLVKVGLLDNHWSIVKEGEFIIFPLKQRIEGAEVFDLPPRERKISPYKKIRKIVGDEIAIPDYWEKLGQIIILPRFKDYEKYGHLVGEAFSKVLNAKTVVIYEGTFGEFREPKVRIIYGDDTETIHTENGIKYKLDVAKVIFSSGNVEERIRISKINAENETIVDLFAGIGYFTLPLAKYGKAQKIYACEKNPQAMRFLIENIHLNSLQNVIPLLGDNRQTAPLKIADRVIMGYIHTEKFLDLGFQTLKENGGIIHYHDTFTTEEKSWKPEMNLKKYGRRNGFDVKILRKEVVKSYAPHIWHLVVDARAIPKN